MPAVSLTNAESKEAASIENTISTYISEQTLKYITGKESLDNVDDFVANMEKQGLDRLLEIEQALQSAISYAGGNNLSAFRNVEWEIF